MMEQWLPLGPIGVISAFNFPVAVWAWNAMLAFVCGDTVVWKPSEKTPLTALACQKIVAEVMGEFPEVAGGAEQRCGGGWAGGGGSAGQFGEAAAGFCDGVGADGAGGGAECGEAAGKVLAGAGWEQRDDFDAVGGPGDGGAGDHVFGGGDVRAAVYDVAAVDRSQLAEADGDGSARLGVSRC